MSVYDVRVFVYDILRIPGIIVGQESGGERGQKECARKTDAKGVRNAVICSSPTIIEQCMNKMNSNITSNGH